MPESKGGMSPAIQNPATPWSNDGYSLPVSKDDAKSVMQSAADSTRKATDK